MGETLAGWNRQTVLIVLLSLSLDVVIVALALRVRNLFRNVQARKRELEVLAATDSLTGLDNRRIAMERAAIEWERSRRCGGNLACLLIDIDHFKIFNDRLGHRYGDLILQEFASVLKKHTRKMDIVGCIGGEEFVVFLAGTSRPDAWAFAEKIRSKTAEVTTKLGPLHISIGIADLGHEPESLNQLLDFADKALYWAKEHGRNRTVSYEMVENPGAPPAGSDGSRITTSMS